jgi:hypothetical protein
MANIVRIANELNEKLDIPYEIRGAFHSDLATLEVDVPDRDSDYKSTAQTIIDAIGSFEGDMRLVYQTSIPMTEAERIRFEGPQEVSRHI